MAYISIILVFIIILIYYTNTKHTDDNDECIEYKIVKDKKIMNIDDMYNIKEYDTINNNIIIHNKFKNELLDYNKQKYTKEVEEGHEKKLKQQEKQEIILKNAMVLKQKELELKNMRIINETNNIKINMKKELNDFITDYKNKLATKKDALIIINNLQDEILKMNTYLNSFNSINKNTYLSKAPLDKIHILNKKIRLYSKVINL